MSKFSLELTGMFPRSEALVKATRDADRKRITEQEFQQVLVGQQTDLLKLQKQLSIDLLSDGMLNWQDIFRPFSVICKGLKLGTLTRFADTNTFFRQPCVVGSLEYTGQEVDKYFSGINKQGQWKVVLPAPFFLARVADDRHYKSTEKLVKAFTEVLVSLINFLKEANYQSFQLVDPYLGFLGATDQELQLVVDSTNKLINKTETEVGYHVAYTCSKQTAQALLQTDLTAIGIDFFNTDIDSLPSFNGKKALLAGCLDSRASLVEEPQALVDFFGQVEKKLKPREVRATTNIDFQFVPVDIASKKLLSLQKAIQLFTRKEKV